VQEHSRTYVSTATVVLYNGNVVVVSRTRQKILSDEGTFVYCSAFPLTLAYAITDWAQGAGDDHCEHGGLNNNTVLINTVVLMAYPDVKLVTSLVCHC
jgi:hypothetical protein